MSDLAAWLENLGLGQYQETFAVNDIDIDVLSDLTEAHLKELGISLGHRVKLLKAISALSSQRLQNPLSVDAPAGADSSPGPTAERRQLTVMFVDLVESTALSGRLDPEDMRELILAYQNTVAGEITRYEGHVAKYMGDGVLAYFGWPRSHEHEAERAVHAGLAVSAAVARLLTPDRIELKTRIGIATGLVVVGDLVGEGAAREQSVVGETPNLAARLQSVAEPGRVVISEGTRSLLGEVFDLQLLGTRRLKGFERAVAAYSVLGERGAESRFLAQRAKNMLPMVGREHELARLLDHWQQAMGGKGQMVLLSGDAGLGKSRLVQALNDALSNQPHYRVHYQCSPYHGDSALYPAIRQLARAAGFVADDNDEARLDKLEAVLGLALDHPLQAAPLLATLLGVEGTARYGALHLSPLQQRVQTLQTLIDQITGLSRRQPVLFVCEDAHWIDPTTLELIELALDAIAQKQILIVMTSRPAFSHRFGGHRPVTPITLDRLGREAALGIIERLSTGKSLPDELRDEIIRKTDGVPLFVEELTKTVLESGLPSGTGHASALEGPLRNVNIPNSLHDSLMARLDRLPLLREVAQTAACIGREFSYRLLSAILPLEEASLRSALAQLIEIELVFRYGAEPETGYIFKHALVRDVAYESLLKSKRQQIHARLLSTLEQQPDAAPEILAHHATKAEAAEKAIRYWQQAGEHAIQRSANTEAISQLGQAIELLGRQDASVGRHQRELDLQIAISAPLVAAKGFIAPEVAAANARARELCDIIGKTPKIIPTLSNLQRYYAIVGEFGQASEVSQESYQILQQSEAIDPAWIALVYNNLGATAMLQGDFDTAVRSHRRGVKHSDTRYRELQILVYGEDMGITCRGFLAMSQWILGYPDQARMTLRQARERAERFSHPFSLAWTHTFALVVSHYLRNAVSVCKRAEATRAFATEHGLPSFEPINLLFWGWARSLRHRDPKGVEQIERVIADLDAIGFKMWSGYFRSILAEARQATGQNANALKAIDEAIVFAARIEERHTLAESHRLKGELLLKQPGRGGVEEAEICFGRALEIAREQRAKSWELRAATFLARSLRDRGERRQARDLLTPVYDWFTEGLDTADLRAAKTLLDELI